jgi:hypothetical protein
MSLLGYSNGLKILLANLRNKRKKASFGVGGRELHVGI